MKKVFPFIQFHKVTLIIALISAFNSLSAQYNFTVTECNSVEEAEALIDSVLLGNVNPAFKQNITVTGDPRAIGYFTNGFIFEFTDPSGIVLSTGFTDDLDISNDCASQNESGNNNGGSDPDLEVLAGMGIHDACVIEFDLMLFNDSVHLSYVFGSEEYHDYVNSGFNDVFGFFVSGPGIEGPFTNNAVNIAEIPGTHNPVSISNVNCGNHPAGCNPSLPGGPNCEYLVDNTQTNQSGFSQTVLDAFTIPFITSQEIQSYEWYHFKLALGDAGDAMYDSGVLLERGSIVSIPVPEVNVLECETELDVIHYVDTVLLSNVMDENKANITFSGDPKAIGYFANTGFLMLDSENGLVLSNGYASESAKQNICESDVNITTDNDGLDSDVDLELLSDGVEVKDVAIIEFDYLSLNDTINFSYVFASEDYHDAINNGNNDVFGIFLSGPGIDGEFENNAVNIATIPGTGTPVNSGTINFGEGGLTCTPTPDDCLNCEYLVDNSQKPDTAFFAFAYDGYTVPLHSTYIVEAGEWYHIKIAIGDVETEEFDSGIFLAEGTLISDSTMVKVSEKMHAEYLKIIPNPATNYIDVKHSGNNPIIEYTIYDTRGRLIERELFSKRISLADLPDGLLIIELKTMESQYRRKFLHQ